MSETHPTERVTKRDLVEGNAEKVVTERTAEVTLFKGGGVDYSNLRDMVDAAKQNISGAVAVDSETMGLRLGRDPLCVVQLSAGDGDAHIVRLGRPDYDAPNLKRLLQDPAMLKIFHFGQAIL